jgi:hypothetical protein
MKVINYYEVTNLPQKLIANSIYLVKSTDGIKSYYVDASRTAYPWISPVSIGTVQLPTIYDTNVKSNTNYTNIFRTAYGLNVISNNFITIKDILAITFTTIGTQLKSVKDSIGSLSGLQTTNKSSIVNAINELKNSIDSLGGSGLINDS